MLRLWLQETKHQFRDKWTERWTNNFRTELQLGFGRSTRLIDTLIGMRYGAHATAADNISPSLLLDWRTQRFVREFRIQERIGPSWYGGRLFNMSSYQKSLDNKLDVSLKAGRNVFIRLLLNITYLFDEHVLKYDMAEFKATAIF
jgi:hypothetical protein